MGADLQSTMMPLSRTFVVLAAFFAKAVAEMGEDDSEGVIGDDEHYGGGEHEGDEDSEPRGPSAVYVMEHGFLTDETPKWLPRGTLLLAGTAGQGFEARLSDAKEFVQLRPEFLETIRQEAEADHYYAVRMYNPESPR